MPLFLFKKARIGATDARFFSHYSWQAASQFSREYYLEMAPLVHPRQSRLSLEPQMDDRVVVLQAVLLSLAATWWIPSSLRRKGQKRNLELVSWFIGFTMFGVLTNVDRFPVPELLLRSILLGLVPIVGGYLFYRLSTGQKKDN